ncbi:MAG TPA: TolC family protein [Candidatus Angelobacter sp.]|nr:TolC family protein [Candidatus Angelobacter sp.]
MRLSSAAKLLLALICAGSATMIWSQASSAPAPAPLTLTLQDALARARANSVQFQAALTDQGVAHQDKIQAFAALLPSVAYNNQAIYTQSNGAQPVFIANNAPHEYVSQANVHESLALSGVSDFHRSRALEAVTRAKTEIAARGLVVTVVQTYYGLLAAQRKYASMQEAAAEAQRFLDLSQKLENGGEVAHSDVIKAQIQAQQRQRDLREAQLTMQKSRLDLAVLLFPDFNENFTIVDDADLAPPLQSFDEVARAAQVKNPDVRASSAALQAARYELLSARAGYLPTLTVDYFYGIDAARFATHETVLNPPGPPELVNNLGYSVAATISVPVWNWGATHSKAVQADLRRKQAERELSFAQRKLQADIRGAHAEADAARSELDTLRSSAELSAESLRLTTIRYQSGEATVLEVVDAQNTLTLARNAYDDGVVRYRVSLANLQTLTGTM